MTRVKKRTLAALVALALAAGALASGSAAELADKASPKLFLAGMSKHEGQQPMALNFTKIEYKG